MMKCCVFFAVRTILIYYLDELPLNFLFASALLLSFLTLSLEMFRLQRVKVRYFVRYLRCIRYLYVILNSVLFPIHWLSNARVSVIDSDTLRTLFLDSFITTVLN
jgi:hypothetical protein